MNGGPKPRPLPPTWPRATGSTPTGCCASWPWRGCSRAQQLMMPAPPGQPKNWAAYRARFVEPRRIAAGAEFWNAHEAELARAEARWGVPAEIVVGIIGVETFYGRFMGKFRVPRRAGDAGLRLSQRRSDRSDYFREELEAMLVLARRETWRRRRCRAPMPARWACRSSCPAA